MPKVIAKFLSKYRRFFLFIFDMAVVLVAYTFTWVLISGRTSFDEYLSLMISSAFLFTSSYGIVFFVTGMYDSLWRYAEIVEFFRCLLSSALAVLIFSGIGFFIFTEKRIPISVYALSSAFASTFTLYTRLTYRMYRNVKISSGGMKNKRVLLIGAGDAASTLLHEIQKSPNKDMNILCVVDDDKEKLGRSIIGVHVVGTTNDIPEIAEQWRIDTILIAIPTLAGENRKRILDICTKTNCVIRTLPDLPKLIADGEDISSRITDIKVEDLLGREPIVLAEESTLLVKNKTVFVTGGGGSIGSELCRQISELSPKLLVIIDIYENSAYAIQQELMRKHAGELNLLVRVASVRDEGKMDDLFNEFKPDVVFHAAAHKHVPLMEDVPDEAVKNNVFGTYNCALAAEKHGVEKFVLISTDKAVNPTNVMGATKRICEMIVQNISLNATKTKFVAVRFGNVLGSNGSVLPLFKEQLAEGGPITVTHKDIVRYFMTIPEAVSLVLEAGAMADKNGEIFVLDMGEPVKILTLAENLIKMSGAIPYRDIDIVFTGLRPGEKLYEELMQDEESVRKTFNKKIFIGSPLKMDSDRFFEDLLSLKTVAMQNNKEDIINMLKDIVPTYKQTEFFLD